MGAASSLWVVMHNFLKFKILNISKNSYFLFCPRSLIILFVKKILIVNQARESSPPIINCRPIITQLNFTNKRNTRLDFYHCMFVYFPGQLAKFCRCNLTFYKRPMYLTVGKSAVYSLLFTSPFTRLWTKARPNYHH